MEKLNQSVANKNGVQCRNEDIQRCFLYMPYKQKYVVGKDKEIRQKRGDKIKDTVIQLKLEQRDNLKQPAKIKAIESTEQSGKLLLGDKIVHSVKM